MRSNTALIDHPLVVDLDGTLIRTDLLVECASKFLIRHPFAFFQLAVWLIRGKVTLKSELARRIEFDVCALPYNLDVLDWLRTEKLRGRHLVLATASHRILADQVAAHLNLFDEVLATDDGCNLAASAKAEALIARFGEYGYDYVGNDWPDLEVWAKSQTSHVVDVSGELLAQTQALGPVGRVFSSQRKPLVQTLIQAMRVHQWMKNLLVFVPLMAAHQYLDSQRDIYSVLAFVIFSLTASSVYLLNDLADVQDDRLHVRKCNRPFANGSLSLIIGWFAWPSLLLMSALLSLSLMPALFSFCLLVYFLLTVSYSLHLKQLAVVDVLTLAALYTLRIIAGAAAIDVSVSFWLLLFSMFVFLSLALIKRYSELLVARGAGKTGALRGRGYEPEDLALVSSLGGSSGFIAVLVLALYIQDGQAAHLYATPQIIWLACPALLFWISRAWLIAHRGRMHDDPIVFALKDRVSWGIGVFMVAVFVLARIL